ncbi:unnamed protein product [Rotaria socialis]|uniref:Uncharacterized protein n=1 Tax=Rotaria socialis TaxID=392032 RepID=A0A820UYC7_9BILA|nr:unnamed protein product [Rotaria socialis]CAF3425889.1 unnamed protein product [Rotaria socialis]CAF3465692.1 unnamed protein product [Rotaria socialis]CAF3472281.1 unnamed protein product [Rotaria socialis]CAF4252607.1 unnamed protein product [Rotaria socialis]
MPCSKIGIAYETFVVTHVDFHQVCSSTFVKQIWINSIILQNPVVSSTIYDIRYYLKFFWEFIAGFCSVSNSTWVDAVTSFSALRIVSPMAIDKQNLRIQAQIILDSSILTAQVVLTRHLLAIRRTTTENQFVSGLNANVYLSYSSPDLNNTNIPKMWPRVYNNCSCLNYRGCPHSILINNSHQQSVTIPGMIGDCFIGDATLASTLESYYNSACFSLLHKESSKNVSLLLNSSSNHFLTNSTIQMFFNETMIDSWSTEIMFESFY